MAGVTFLIPKNENTENPKNYRPVTCLPTMYKCITSVISRRKQKYTWMMNNWYQKNRKGTTEDQNLQRTADNFKSNTTRM